MKLDDMGEYFASMPPPARPAREEDALLVRLARDGDREARDRLVLGHWGLVVWIAKRYRRCGVPMADLVNEGVLGLLRALETYDSSHGTKLSTYATFWIRQTIQRAVGNQSRLVRVPDCNTEARRVPERRASLDAPVDDDRCLGDLIADRRGPSPVEGAHESLRREAIAAALDRLPPREAAILRLRFGLADGFEYTLEEVGRIFRVTRERVRQIQVKALKRLGLPGRLPAA